MYLWKERGLFSSIFVRPIVLSCVHTEMCVYTHAQLETIHKINTNVSYSRIFAICHRMRWDGGWVLEGKGICEYFNIFEVKIYF